MSLYKQIFIYGFAIFAMFFGSGNLVFPLQIGQALGSNWFIGYVGLLLTGILLPFLGLLVIKLYRGSYLLFFNEAGALAKFLLPLFTLSLLGSFGVVPRCITVAHGGIEQLFPSIPLAVFSFIFCLITYALCLRDHILFQALGKWMTPILLCSLLILIIIGFIHAPAPLHNEAEIATSFMTGFLTGYQTMDLFAAFFFSSLLFKQIASLSREDETPQAIIKAALKPSIFGASLLAMVYLGFVFLGAHYQSITQGVSPELILPTIAHSLLGDNASLFIAVIFIFSCLTTAVALTSIYTRHLCDLLNFKDKFFPHTLFVTILISFGISLLDFQGIAAFLAPSLEASYPAIILLTVVSIFIKGHKRVKMLTFYGILFLTLWVKYMG